MRKLMTAITPPSYRELERDLVRLLWELAGLFGLDLTGTPQRNPEVEAFDREDTLLVISSYPPPGGEPARLNAVACYTENLLNAYEGKRAVVLCEEIEGPQLYRKDNLLILRSFRKGSPLLFLDLWRALAKFKQPERLLVQFEFNMFASTLASALLPLFLFLAKLSGKRVTVVLHQVVTKLDNLHGHLGLSPTSLKTRLLNLGLRLFYRGLDLAADRLIVHEQVLKNRLSRWVNKKKISVISHGLALEEPQPQAQLRRQYAVSQKSFVILAFGYLNWYKGADWIIKKVGTLAREHPKANLKLIVAGGESATLNHKPHYQRFLRSVQDLGKKYRQAVTLTGYVPEEKVSDYFSLADLVVLPYRAMISASGPLSFALRFNKPFLASGALTPIFANPDFKGVITSLNLSKTDLTFSLKGDEFAQKLLTLSQNRTKLARLNRVASHLRTLRSWETVVAHYQQVLEKEPQPSWIAHLKESLGRTLTRRLALIRFHIPGM